MSVDLGKDLVLIFGWAINLSTVVIWLSAILGFLINLLYNRAHYLKLYRESKLSEIATDAFAIVEKTAKLTPMTSDDKLIEMFKLSIKAYRQAFGKKPSKQEMAYLGQKAKALAAKDKVRRMTQAELLAKNA